MNRDPANRPKYRPGDRLLAYVTVDRSAHCDSVFVLTDSRQAAQLKESDIHSAVLLKFKAGDRVAFQDGDIERTATVLMADYSAEPPQAWLNVDTRWPRQTSRITDLRRLPEP